MEKITMKLNSKKYGFKKGDEFVVKRNVCNECIIIRKDDPNIIIKERKARRYGDLTGRPQLCFN